MSEHVIELGDVIEVLQGYEDNSFDAVLCDPPYFLEFMGKAWDSAKADIPVNEALFRAWLAGLVAGEAYFRIHKQKEGAYYACHFGIHMRADEAPLLRALCARIGIGQIKEENAVTGKAVNSAPSIRWEVTSRADCTKLAGLLEGSPLYGKKQREFDLWRKALAAWTYRERGNRWKGAGDNSEMEAAYLEMKSLRPFDQDLADSHFDPFAGSAYGMHYAWAKEVLRVLKPGAPLIAFSGTRTYHRLACAIEDAGFEIRDCFAWMYGSGFPKSLNLDGTHKGYGTALKPAYEPAVLARKPLDGTVAENVAKWGVGGLAIDASRIDAGEGRPLRQPLSSEGGTVSFRGVSGASKALGERACTEGRWPANVLLDEETAALLDAQTGNRPSNPYRENTAKGDVLPLTQRTAGGYADSGGASRFFYTAKVSKKERGEGNNHPTVKPIALMTYLAKLLLPPSPGAILIPFAGSGSEMIGALKAGWPAVVGIERESAYVEIALRRLAEVA